MDLKDCKIYLVTDEKACNGKDFYKCIEESIKGGVKIVQLREKNISTKDFYKKALKVKEICKNYEVLFIINDRLDITQAVEADGVHLGQSDMPIEKAREILKDKFLIGATARNIEEAEKAQLLGADYIGSGAIFGTSTKDNAKRLEMEDLKKIVNSVKIPVFAIGGININNVWMLKNIGLQGVCSVSGILSEKDCKKAVENILKNFN
ncbi:thiamine phosphate synthase [Fusobacterium nucleatum subsp. nucleatum ATCC 23726]|uniref:Thiamine-phosphate synthase n=3 Tax=Fusobacterium nucleatum subsp. nucleatum TaxID=76856 RepID=THIE_FUSNN|nr:thiamine phosphate synthase [Fusobacterium nucleatum]Q8RI59.1 RecName: Full=Thiamine-phosphate synthase; Short=TP synthase; Short=TPS; AltName: Full=Thiamine-phosphate pyrophosphorylase; Short=TMP pyrophosphorylase; Short=TMP-PPase [Fusobacterium nucleatum subsp. nucleatum ATCC 25586]AAL93873.1 Thiamin-phosphate pyrophosphorylase [Fusobacterium nucleatum subsp. nucleatum ATCC 25586]ALF23179.1 thiamine-phosphate synthase [Fusobacterium nucleatum subsp. nucleatum ChDC F316]ALF26133.1 thiamine-